MWSLGPSSTQHWSILSARSCRISSTCPRYNGDRFSPIPGTRTFFLCARVLGARLYIMPLQFSWMLHAEESAARQWYSGRGSAVHSLIRTPRHSKGIVLVPSPRHGVGKCRVCCYGRLLHPSGRLSGASACQHGARRSGTRSQALIDPGRVNGLCGRVNIKLDHVVHRIPV